MSTLTGWSSASSQEDRQFFLTLTIRAFDCQGLALGPACKACTLPLNYDPSHLLCLIALCLGRGVEVERRRLCVECISVPCTPLCTIFLVICLSLPQGFAKQMGLEEELIQFVWIVFAAVGVLSCHRVLKTLVLFLVIHPSCSGSRVPGSS